MAPLQSQTLHPKHHPFQRPRQRVGECDLGCHFFTDYSFSQRLVGGLKVSQHCNTRTEYSGRWGLPWWWGQGCGAWRWSGWLTLAGSRWPSQRGSASGRPDPPAGSGTVGRVAPTGWSFLHGGENVNVNFLMHVVVLISSYLRWAEAPPTSAPSWWCPSPRRCSTWRPPGCAGWFGEGGRWGSSPRCWAQRQLPFWPPCRQSSLPRWRPPPWVRSRCLACCHSDWRSRQQCAPLQNLMVREDMSALYLVWQSSNKK